ncbi:MAG: dihydropteroate synthase [Saprospiraceae bacterium]|nr:dihydropteroate synthase [Saprospiraceae bacterium]
MLYEQTTINCRGQLLELTSPIVMGIINVTPDSFYADSRAPNVLSLLEQVELQLTEGAAIIDVGGMSTRPGAEMISEIVEMNRILPAIRAISRAFPEAIISVDTFRASIARACVEEGAHIINDVSGGCLDEQMFATVAELGVPYILMHMRGTPQTMSQLTDYEDIALDLLDYFIEKVGILRGLKVKDIILDTGFGFAKTPEQSFELLAKLSVFQILECPILVGLSRKGMIWKTLGVEPKDSLNGTTAAHMLALQGGAKILRAHDVTAALEAIKIFEAYKKHTKHDCNNI